MGQDGGGVVAQQNLALGPLPFDDGGVEIDVIHPGEGMEDGAKLLPELFPHGSIQLRDNVFQRLLRLDQIIVLSFQESIPLHHIFIVFYRVHIDIAQLPDLILKPRDVPLHSPKVRQLLLP